MTDYLTAAEVLVIPDDDTPDPLTIPEACRREELEQVIRAGLDTFWAVGSALAEIRDSRLYRQTHSTFEDYCQERWQIGRSYASRLVNAAEVRGNLLERTGTAPVKESQARELAKLPPEEQATAWSRANEATAGKPTAKAIRQAVQELESAELNPERRTPNAETTPTRKPRQTLLIITDGNNRRWTAYATDWRPEQEQTAQIEQIRELLPLQRDQPEPEAEPGSEPNPEGIGFSDWVRLPDGTERQVDSCGNKYCSFEIEGKKHPYALRDLKLIRKGDGTLDD